MIAELSEFFWKSGKKMQKTFAAVMCVHRFCKYFAECRCRLAGVNAPIDLFVLFLEIN